MAAAVARLIPFEQLLARSKQSAIERTSSGRRISRDSVIHPSLSVLAHRLQYRSRIQSAKKELACKQCKPAQRFMSCVNLVLIVVMITVVAIVAGPIVV